MSREFTFLVSPSLGIVDNWLPVLVELKSRHPDLRISLVIPRAQSVREISFESVLMRIAEAIIDRVIWRDESGRWIESASLCEASQAQQSRSQVRSFSARVWSNVSKRFWKQSSFSDLQLFEKDGTLIYDVYEENKRYNADVISSGIFNQAFSLCHGIDISQGGRDPHSIPGFEACRSRMQPETFLFSELEKGYYEKTFGLPIEKLRVVGVPRHEPDWIKRLQFEDAPEIGRLPQRFIGLISRPHNPKYLPIERKIETLKALKRVASELDLPIVLKKHPKQKDKSDEKSIEDGLYERIFERSELGRSWFITRAHWLALGPRCAFAMSFFSGVVTDMAALGVPTVEWLDLVGLPKYDTAAALREPDGTPVFSYRYLGLVSGATTAPDLRRFAERALEKKEETAAPMVARYQDIFGDPKGAIGRVADQVEGLSSEVVSLTRGDL